jgi:hypothetical protein
MPESTRVVLTAGSNEAPLSGAIARVVCRVCLVPDRPMLALLSQRGRSFR